MSHNNKETPDRNMNDGGLTDPLVIKIKENSNLSTHETKTNEISEDDSRPTLIRKDTASSTVREYSPHEKHYPHITSILCR
jgi:hypothetical protein